MGKLNSFLHEECVKNGFYFIDSSAVTERDLWKDGVHMVKMIFIYHLNNFLGLRTIIYGIDKYKEKCWWWKYFCKWPNVSNCQWFPDSSKQCFFFNLDPDLCNLQLLKQKYHSNPFISWLNINNLLKKFDSLRQICIMSPLEILWVDETKLDRSFPNSQFKINGYIFPLSERQR